MYDIAVLVTNTPQDLLVHDLVTLSFRLSHPHDGFLSWFAGVRLICLLTNCAFILLYFATRCSIKGLNPLAWLSLTFD